MTLVFISCSINCLQNRVLLKISSILVVEKMCKKQSLCTEEPAQIVTLRNII